MTVSGIDCPNSGSRVDDLAELAVPGRIASLRRSNALVWVLSKTLSKRDELVSSGLQPLDSVRDDIVRSLLVRLVVESEDGAGVLIGDCVVLVFARGGARTSRVARIKIPDDNALPTDTRRLQNKVIVVAVGRTHECGISASDFNKSLFYAPHLVVDLIPSERGQIFVRPCVRCDLMTVVVRVFDAFRWVCAVNTRVVVPVEEESALRASSIERVDDVVQIDIRSVVKSQRDGVGFGAFSVHCSLCPPLKGRHG